MERLYSRDFIRNLWPALFPAWSTLQEAAALKAATALLLACAGFAVSDKAHWPLWLLSGACVFLLALFYSAGKLTLEKRAAPIKRALDKAREELLAADSREAAIAEELRQTEESRDTLRTRLETEADPAHAALECIAEFNDCESPYSNSPVNGLELFRRAFLSEAPLVDWDVGELGSKVFKYSSSREREKTCGGRGTPFNDVLRRAFLLTELPPRNAWGSPRFCLKPEAMALKRLVLGRLGSSATASGVEGERAL